MPKTKTNLEMIEIVALRKANRQLVNENNRLRDLIESMAKSVEANKETLEEYEL